MKLLIGLIISAALGYWAYRLWTGGKSVEVGKQSKLRKPAAILIGFFGVMFALASISIATMSPEERAKMEAEEQAREEERAKAEAEEEAKEQAEAQAELDAEAEEKRKGFHCLSTWDGSNRSGKDQLRAALRDPDSFEHIETRIYPLDDAASEHGAYMRYRARNGFGGMNVEEIYMRINHETCEARLLPDGPGS